MSPSDPSDGLDPVVWNIVSEMIITAHGLNIPAYHQAASRIARNPPVGFNNYSAYFFYLLWKTMFNVLGRTPKLADAESLAERAWPKYSQLLNYSKEVLLATLQDIIDEPDDAPRGPTATAQNLSTSAALGALMTNPLQELLILRPQLAAWYLRQYG